MKIRKSGNIVTTLLTMFLLVSCFSDNTKTELEVYTDAYTVKKMVGGEAVYAVAFYAYGNQMMNSGNVTEIGGSGVQINLGINPGSIFTLWKWPSVSDFKPYPPSAADYKFVITAESGMNNESLDHLNPKNLAIPVIAKTELSENNKLINVTWTSVTGANGFLIKVSEESGNIIYSSDGMLPTVTSNTINILTGNWTKPVEPGKTYIIEVHAFAYEAGTDALYKAYNVEEISIGQKSVTL